MKHYKIRKGRLGIVVALAFIFVASGIMIYIQTAKKPIVTYYIASDQPSVTVNVNNEEIHLIRGSKAKGIKVSEKDSEKMIVKTEQDDREFDIDKRYLAESFEECVTNQVVYPRLMVNLRSDKGASLEKAVGNKGEALPVKKINYDRDFNQNTGEVNGYIIEKEGQEYYIDALYVESSLEEATKAYPQQVIHSTYWDYYFGDGYSQTAYIDSLDYKPFPKKQYSDNPLRTDINAVHISMNIFKQEFDYLLALCKETGINALVVEVKSDIGEIAFESEQCQPYLTEPKRAIENAVVSKSELQSLIERCHQEGVYLIARIVTFKDQIFAQQNSEESILSKEGTLLIHNGENWPSAYSRKSWMYNVAIAKEVAQMGFNEIQFDYVRFPDGLIDGEMSGEINLHNTYDEYKTQALQRFLMYAYEELSPLEAYVAADVFAWPAVAQDDQNIGQFIPALANIADVISPMPYPDHFGPGNMGSDQPWQNPEMTLQNYSEIMGEALNSISSPAIYRTWIQGYACMGHVCKGTPGNPPRDYGSPEMVDQITGINNAGFEGYMVWSGYGGRNMFEDRKAGFISSTLPENKKWKHRFQ
ncbi:putative glycoside hydrolase [Beduini massiliensis]|uniref:putative glycoside hydrolase n=1 Tax=Beduini massiliensis TaxID=1585974 RepID=UPI00059A7A78|nr:putative glycoside hydrolase [Beduini massiliensis]